MSVEGPKLPALVPELLVTDLDRSLAFWRDLIGFAVLYKRPDEHFVMLKLGGAAVMLEQWQPGTRQWIAGDLARPFGRGLNLQIAVSALDPLLERLAAAKWPLFREAHAARYRVGDGAVSLRQCLVQDPDGYLLRFAERLPHDVSG